MMSMNSYCTYNLSQNLQIIARFLCDNDAFELTFDARCCHMGTACASPGKAVICNF